MRVFKIPALIGLSVLVLIMVFVPRADAATKYSFCHIEDLYEMDENGELVLDEDGEEIVIGSMSELKTVPAGAVRAHDRHEADHLPDTYLVAEAVLDEEGNEVTAAVTIQACEPPLDADGNELALVDPGSTDLVESLGIPAKQRGNGAGKGKAGDSSGSNRSAAGTNNDDLQTPADIIHPNIHQNNGPGNAACPGDQDHCQNMHGIGNNPGQSGNKPGDDGVPGFANQLNNVHGGIGTKNKNVGD